MLGWISVLIINPPRCSDRFIPFGLFNSMCVFFLSGWRLDRRWAGYLSGVAYLHWRKTSSSATASMSWFPNLHTRCCLTACCHHGPPLQKHRGHSATCAAPLDLEKERGKLGKRKTELPWPQYSNLKKKTGYYNTAKCTGKSCGCSRRHWWLLTH